MILGKWPRKFCRTLSGNANAMNKIGLCLDHDFNGTRNVYSKGNIRFAYAYVDKFIELCQDSEEVLIA